MVFFASHVEVVIRYSRGPGVRVWGFRMAGAGARPVLSHNGRALHLDGLCRGPSLGVISFPCRLPLGLSPGAEQRAQDEREYHMLTLHDVVLGENGQAIFSMALSHPVLNSGLGDTQNRNK